MPVEQDESLKRLQDLLKASDEGGHSEPDGDEGGKGKGDGDGDEYNAEYMKKHMKRFMKENGSYMKKHMKSDGALSKAAADAFGDLSGAGPDAADLSEADSIMIDGTDFFKAYQESAERNNEVLQNLCKAVDTLGEMMGQQFDLSQAAGEVLSKAYTKISAIGGQPMPRQSVVAGQPEAGQETAPEGHNAMLAKAKEVGASGVRQALIKAIQNGDQDAGDVLAQLDSARSVDRLTPSAQQKVASLLAV